MLKPSKQSTIKSCWYSVEGNAKSVVLYRKHIMWETRKSSWILLQKFGKRCAMRLSDLRSCTSLFMSQVTCNWQIEQNGSPSIEETSFCFLCFKPLRVHLNSVLHRKKALRGVVGAFAVHNTLMQNKRQNKRGNKRQPFFTRNGELLLKRKYLLLPRHFHCKCTTTKLKLDTCCKWSKRDKA